METWHFLILVVVVNSAIWAYFDASRQRDAFQIGVGPDGHPPHKWASWILLFWPAGLPLYLRARSTAQLAEPRHGPPPRFKAGGFTFYAVALGLVGLGIFATLIVFGRFRLATLGLVVAAAGLFGGRQASVVKGSEGVELGELGLEQIGFKPGITDDDQDDGEIANVEEYFSNLASPRGASPSPLGGPPSGASPVPTRPMAPNPGSPSPGPAAPDMPPPPAPNRVSSAPAVEVPQGAPSIQAPPGAPAVQALPGAPAVQAPSGARQGPPAGVVYSPPPAGVVYSPPPPGAPPPIGSAPGAVAPGRPSAAPQSPAPQSPGSQSPGPQSPGAPSPGPTPPVPPAPAVSIQPPPPPPSDPRATVALSSAAVASELRGAQGSPAAGSGQPPRAPAPASVHPPTSPGPPVPPRGPGNPPPEPSPSVAQMPASAPSRLQQPQPLAPGSPQQPQPQAKAPVPRPPGRPPRSAGYGYASAKGAKKGLPWPWIVAAVLAVTAAAAGALFMLRSSDPVEIEPMPEDVVVEEPAEEEVVQPPDLEEVIEEGVDDPEEMDAWLEDYTNIMGAVALTLDEIDYDGIEVSRCQRLRRNIGAASSRLGRCPDAEIDLLISRAISSFNEALKACRANDDPAWALALLSGKESTHEAQELMDRRYLFRGVLELELESATGEERSAESISGRFLASSLP